MKQILYYLIVTVLLMVQTLSTADASEQAPQETVEHVVWNNAPIRVLLPVGVERRIDFPVSVKIEWPNVVRDKTANLQIRENGSVYWTAKSPFTSHRVNVITNTGYSYLLDVEAKKGAPDTPLIVVDNRITKPPSHDKQSNNTSNTEDQSEASSQYYPYDYSDLIRFAAKFLFAPPRLAKPLPGVTRVPVKTVDYPLYKGGDLITRPIAEWRAATMPTLYVTVLDVKSNNSEKQVPLDPRLLRGELLAAAPQHDFVYPKGKSGDSTVWYIVTERPFQEVAP